MIRIATIVGARPQFIKAAALTHEFRSNFKDHIDERLVHTGQHYDKRMSSLFFEELGLPEPEVTLPTFSGDHGFSTGNMLVEIEKALKHLAPDLAIVFGDTNSTLAGALAAVKLSIPVAHVEAGLRSGNRYMPEELNRMITDRISALNFAPSDGAFKQLSSEALGESSRLVGDIMYDAVKLFTGLSKLRSVSTADSSPRKVLVTIHRQENTDSDSRLYEIAHGLLAMVPDFELTLPIHPRLTSALDRIGMLDAAKQKLNIVEPLSFIETIGELRESALVITDSGGLQKEAFYLGVQCITVREETEWPETIHLGWNRLANPAEVNLCELAQSLVGSKGRAGNPFGNGNTSSKIAEEICKSDWAGYFD